MTINPHQTFMQMALETAKSALPADVPVGAVLVRGGEIITCAYNRREVDQNPIAHAEMLVLMEGGKRLQNWRLLDTVLYVTLEPCPMCAAAILQARIPTVVFGAYDPLMGACGSRYHVFESHPNVQIIGGILEAPCREMLHTFFQEKH